MFPILSIVLWIIIIYLIIVLIVTWGYSSGGEKAGYLLWIFILILLAVVFWFDFDECNRNYCGKCGRNPCSCGHVKPSALCLGFNATFVKPANIEVKTNSFNNKQRQVMKLTVNGTECYNDNTFNCEQYGFSETFNVAFPMTGDVLIGMDINQPIELLQWTAPRGTIFTLNYIIPHGMSFITAVPRSNVVTTGQICVDPLYNSQLDNFDIVVYNDNKKDCDGKE